VAFPCSDIASGLDERRYHVPMAGEAEGEEQAMEVLVACTIVSVEAVVGGVRKVAVLEEPGAEVGIE
jgi:hypothetical protein